MFFPLAVWGGFVKLPYLQNITDSTVFVCWEQSESTTARVNFGLSPAKELMVIDTLRRSRHEVLLSVLMPDTVYYYQVVTPSDTSPTGFFRTPAETLNRFRLVIYGDNRTDSVAHQSVVDRIKQVEPMPVVLFNVGDLTENSTPEEYITFFNISRDLLRNQPLFSAIGNHENRNINNYLLNFVLPGNERYYSVRYGNCAFVVIDNYSEFNPKSEQYRWLVKELNRFSIDRDVRHIFVVFHEPPYTTNQRHRGNQAVRQYLCPLFEQYQVRAVFCGHVHAYEHSLINGIHYFTTGGGGAPLYNNWGEPEPWTVYREAVYHFMLVDVVGDTVFLRGVRSDGSEFDSTLLFRRQGAKDSKKRTSDVPVRVVPTVGNRKITVNFNLDQPQTAGITVYNSAGRMVMESGELFLNNGIYTFQLELDQPGSYFAICQLNNRTFFTRFIRL